jgi:2-oxo-3-hexenedioate decarboxylase
VSDVHKWVQYLLDAEERREAVDPITDVAGSLTLDEAYALQDELIARKVAAGQRIVGAKLGLTSHAKQAAMGVHEPVYGWLTDAMALGTEEPLRNGKLIHPRVEPEIVFVLGEDLAGPGAGVPDVLAATAAVCCGLEVIDSRYRDFRFTLPDVVADNTSAARFVLGGSPVAPDFDLSLVGCVLESDGRPVATATGAAALGHPAAAVALLANALGSRGRRLERGWIVLSGGLTDAVAVGPGSNVEASFARLGRVGVRVTD